MQRLEVSRAVRPIYGSLGVKRLTGLILMILNQTANSHFTEKTVRVHTY